jgi:hypothetical protein
VAGVNEAIVILLHDPLVQANARRRILARLLDQLQTLELELAGLVPAMKEAAGIDGVAATAREQALLACDVSASIVRLRSLIQNEQACDAVGRSGIELA